MWIVQRPDGSSHGFMSKPDPVRDAPIVRQYETDVDPDPAGCEDWDWDTLSWVKNADRATRWIDVQAGPIAIATAHAVKVLEARLLMMGTDVQGMLAAEAEATDQDLATLAQTVIAKADAETVSEVQRIVLKREARG